MQRPRGSHLTSLALALGSLALAPGCAWLIEAALVPSVRFDPADAPPAPDYTQRGAWAARPDVDDLADVTPQGEHYLQAAASADVFFVHPTTYYSNASWNQPLDDDDVNELTDDAVLRNQASVFNSSAAVWAPRYRQATLGVFVTDRHEDADGAMELAYGDVEAAFDEFLAQRGDPQRPFILASHSQGSYHAYRLLATRIDGDAALRERLVAAYLIGVALPDDVFTRALEHVGVCRSAGETGCVITYNSLTEDADTERLFGRSYVHYPGGYESNEGKTLTCVNPLTWATDEQRADASLNLGGVRFLDDDDHPAPDPALTGATCAGGLLEVDEVSDKDYTRALGITGNYHIVDYSLFYMNLRRNAEERTQALLAGD